MDTRMMNHFDAIVLGVGAMGSAACFQLARRGVRVLGLEQFDIPHTRGSSGGFSRMIRLAYYEHPDYVPLLRRAYELWREIEEISGKKLLHITGGIYMGTRDGEVVRGAMQSARQHSLDHELLDHAEITRRYPQFQLPEDHVGVYEPIAGMLLPERCIASFVESALRNGAEIHANEVVRSWKSDAAGVTVTTDRGTYHAEGLVLCGGAWNGRLQRDPGIQLTVTRQPLMWVWPTEPQAFSADRSPVWGVGLSDGSLFYGFPMGLDEGVGLKVAIHARGQVVDPDTIAREPQPGDEAPIRAMIRKYIPRGDGPTLALRICMYSNTADSHFVIDRHRQHERVTCAFACSGHGFKFASVVGEIVADLVQRGRSALPIGFVSATRAS